MRKKPLLFSHAFATIRKVFIGFLHGSDFACGRALALKKRKGEINMSTKGLWKHVLITEGAVESPKECLLDKLAASLHVSTREFHTKMTSLGFHLPDFLSSEN